MKNGVIEKALALGFDDCRVATATPPARAGLFRRWLEAGRHGEMAWIARNAEKRSDPSLVLPGCKSIVFVAASYYTPSSSAPAGAPFGTVAKYARYSDYHDVLASRLAELAQHLTDQAGEGGRSLWYLDTGPILERELAERAGLGFVGKHTNLISRKLGNYFFIGEILTTLELDPDEPETNRCGSCVRCMTACPTNAITAPFELDARRCISYLTIELKGSIPEEFRPLIGNRIFGCDDCLDVCPWNRFAHEGRLMAQFRKQDLDQAELLKLLNLDQPAFKQRFAGTPILRSKRRGLLRNVCVALGNVGGPEALPALERAALDPEPLIAEHARWAIEQIQRRLY